MFDLLEWKPIQSVHVILMFVDICIIAGESSNMRGRVEIPLTGERLRAYLLHYCEFC